MTFGHFFLNFFKGHPSLFTPQKYFINIFTLQTRVIRQQTQSNSFLIIVNFIYLNLIIPKLLFIGFFPSRNPLLIIENLHEIFLLKFFINFIKSLNVHGVILHKLHQLRQFPHSVQCVHIFILFILIFL